MIIRPRKTTKDRYPDVVLRCDGVACNERETFAHGTTYAEISMWTRKHHWSIKYRNGQFEHRCSACERLTKLSPRDIERLIA